MKTISMFVDESGDLGLKNKGKTYYIVTLVFHNQDYDISEDMNKLDRELSNLHCPKGAVHTEPLIRREAPYEAFTPNERRAIFTKLFFFAKKCDISYKTFIFEKQQFKDEMKLEAKIAREISLFIRNNLSYFQSFDELVLYYDNGQKQLSRILNTVLATEIVDYDVRKVRPSDYRLFQVADLICTLELLNKKMEEGEQLSRSEQFIFHSKRDFKKDFMKKIVEKRFKE
ncbi:MAG: DUF3800 domain-containing protein [Eubacterium sp.]|nr:DUF3800 domain-containing protein [Eubacterium sp.]